MSVRSVLLPVRLPVTVLAAPVVAGVVAAAGLAPAQAAGAPGWRVYKTIPVADTNLWSVVATGPGDAWAGGQTPARTPVVYHWNGRAWKARSRPGPTGSFAASVSASSPSNAWVAIANTNYVDHWNGRSWRRVALGSYPTSAVEAVVTTGRKNVWAFSFDATLASTVETAYHYNGRHWSHMALPAEIDGGGLTGLVSASSAASIWAWSYDVPHARWQTLHYNRGKWQVVKIPASLVPAGDSFIPKEMLATSATSAWATVYAYNNTTVGPIVLLRWNGRKWSKITRHLPAGALTGPIASDGHGGLWLSAANAARTTSFLLHYRSGTWTKVKLPHSTLGSVSVNAEALIPGARSLWAVGQAGPDLETVNGAVILKYGR